MLSPTLFDMREPFWTVDENASSPGHESECGDRAIVGEEMIEPVEDPALPRDSLKQIPNEGVPFRSWEIRTSIGGNEAVWVRYAKECAGEGHHD